MALGTELGIELGPELGRMEGVMLGVALGENVGIKLPSVETEKPALAKLTFRMSCSETRYQDW